MKMTLTDLPDDRYAEDGGMVKIFKRIMFNNVSMYKNALPFERENDRESGLGWTDRG
jgi:hypothetical protein